jgi:hypothetical protein
VLRSHRDAPRLLAERPPAGPIRRRLADTAVGLVLQAGFPEADAAVISLLLGDYVISIVSEEMRLEAQAAHVAQGEEIPWESSQEYHNLAPDRPAPRGGPPRRPVRDRPADTPRRPRTTPRTPPRGTCSSPKSGTRRHRRLSQRPPAAH